MSRQYLTVSCSWAKPNSLGQPHCRARVIFCSLQAMREQFRCLTVRIICIICWLQEAKKRTVGQMFINLSMFSLMTYLLRPLMVRDDPGTILFTIFLIDFPCSDLPCSIAYLFNNRCTFFLYISHIERRSEMWC